MSDDETELWAELGRAMMQSKLEIAGSDVETAFRNVASKVEAGETVDADDVEALYRSLDSAEYAVRLLVDTVPEATPRRQIEEPDEE